MVWERRSVVPNKHPDVRAQAEYDKIHPKLVPKVARNTFINEVTIS